MMRSQLRAPLGASRDTWFALGLLGLLVLITAAAGLQQSQKQEPPALDSFSSTPNGALALRTWLDETGFTVVDNKTNAFWPPLSADFALVLEPLFTLQPNEWTGIDRWVEAGGTLVLAGSEPAAQLAVEHYDFSLQLLLGEQDELALEAPWFSPPFSDATLAVGTGAYLTSERNDFITHLSSSAGPVLVSFRKGRGQVFLCATAYPFTNRGLKDDDAPGMLANLFSFGTQKSRLTVWFDEWHHGAGRKNAKLIVGPGQWLRRTPAGQSLLYVAALLIVALALQGRRFGRPVPLPKELSRRRPLEHITALANLTRLAGQRGEILRHYHRQIKRQLGSRYRLDPSLPDGEWVLQLGRVRPELDSAALLGLLERLRQPTVSESELVKLAREASDWLGGPGRTIEPPSRQDAKA